MPQRETPPTQNKMTYKEASLTYLNGKRKTFDDTKVFNEMSEADQRFWVNAWIHGFLVVNSNKAADFKIEKYDELISVLKKKKEINNSFSSPFKTWNLNKWASVCIEIFAYVSVKLQPSKNPGSIQKKEPMKPVRAPTPLGVTTKYKEQIQELEKKVQRFEEIERKLKGEILILKKRLKSADSLNDTLLDYWSKVNPGKKVEIDDHISSVEL